MLDTHNIFLLTKTHSHSRANHHSGVQGLTISDLIKCHGCSNTHWWWHGLHRLWNPPVLEGMYLIRPPHLFNLRIFQWNIGSDVQVSVSSPHALGSATLGCGAWFCQSELMEFADSIYVHRNRMILAGRGRTSVEQAWHETDCLLFSTVCWFNLQTHSPTPLARPIKTQGPP